MADASQYPSYWDKIKTELQAARGLLAGSK